MARTTQTVIALRAGPLAASQLAVRRIHGREALSEPYSFELHFQPTDDLPLSLADLGGQEALLTLRRPDGTERHVHGLLWSAELVDVVQGKPRYSARLVPRLERLRHVRRSRVFQKLSVPEVVKKVLDEGKVKHRLALSASHPPREYCVQYRESDLDFVSRLLEDEGIFYRFEHAEDEHVMVLADAAGGCAALPGDEKVPYRVRHQAGDEAEAEHLSRLELVQRVRPGKVALRDFDFLRPQLDVAAASRAASDALALEHYEYPGGFRDPGAGAPVAKLRLEELRFGAENLEGESTCLRFAPGLRFEAAEHPEAGFDRKLLLVRVEHDAAQQEGPGSPEAIEHGYRNTFLALDAQVPYRPRRRTPWPVACAETATVVGPGGEEIHADPHAGVKVQLHWDREGKKDEHSSCWIRVAQTLAGPGWGASFVPRIGQEVLVRFLEGDPDQPLVLGAIYNGSNAPPAGLPGEKTQSTLRTDSSPGGGGANELRFEDAAGDEEILLHAQKDKSTRVLRDKRQKVLADEQLAVANDRARDVGGHQALRVNKDDVAKVDGRQTLEVQGARETRVDGGETESVELIQSSAVSAAQKTSVKSASALRVGAAAALNVGGGLTVKAATLDTAVGAVLAVQIGGDREEEVKKDRTETVGANASLKVSDDFETTVKGKASQTTASDVAETVSGKRLVDAKGPAVFTANRFSLEADSLSIKVGGTRILAMDKSGAIKLSANALVLDGDKITLKAAEVKKQG
jgi:type VI secretion system secreted protein VgrG